MGTQSLSALRADALCDVLFYHRHASFTNIENRRCFEDVLESVRRAYRLCVNGYVVMPEHLHLLLSEPERDTVADALADALKSLKKGVSRRLIGNAEHFWQKRYYDFNIRNVRQFEEKLRYIHLNPVRRGLCDSPESWEWSSFRQYISGCDGRVGLNASGPQGGVSGPRGSCVLRCHCPTQANIGLEWAIR